MCPLPHCWGEDSDATLRLKGCEKEGRRGYKASPPFSIDSEVLQAHLSSALLCSHTD